MRASKVQIVYERGYNNYVSDVFYKPKRIRKLNGFIVVTDNNGDKVSYKEHRVLQIEEVK